MKIHHLRNATFVIESKQFHILIDPMLGEKGSLPPFSYFKYKAKKNPVVELPAIAERVLTNVTHCLVTHSQKWGIEALTHTDHFDIPGKKFLKKNHIPVVCSKKDAAYMRKKGLTTEVILEPWKTLPFLEGQITAIPALHGHSWTNKMMANGVGFFIELADEPSIYISGDTVLTDDVKRALVELRPDIAVVAAGGASIDVGRPILMTIDEILEFVKTAPKKVIANHMEALNHCPTTREMLKKALKQNDLDEKVFIPEDGGTLSF